MIQLGLEYDPQPPLDSGSPEKAGADRVAQRVPGAGGMVAGDVAEPQIAQAAHRSPLFPDLEPHSLKEAP